MKPILLTILPLFFFGSCQQPSFQADEQAIRAVMERQEADWDAGDVRAFMNGYTDSVCFIGSKGMTCGREAVTANYLRNYPDKAAMGDLSFTDLEILPAGADHAWCTGQWKIVRAETVGGGFSLLWQRTPQGWRILRDHSY